MSIFGDIGKFFAKATATGGLRQILDRITTSTDKMIEEIYRIVKVIEIKLKKDIGKDKYDKEKENVEMPKSFVGKFWDFSKRIFNDFVEAAKFLLPLIPPDAWINKKDDKTKDTEKSDELTGDPSYPMMTESGVMVEPANFVPTENQGEKEDIEKKDATEEKYNQILEKLDALTNDINQTPESENEDNIETKYSAILEKLDTLIEEEKQKIAITPQDNTPSPVKDIDSNPIIEMVSTKIDEADTSQIREIEKMREEVSNSIDTLVKKVEKNALSFDNIYNMLARRMADDHKYKGY